MNKTLGLFLVAGLLFVSAANVSAVAPINGCKLKHDITIGTTTTGINTTVKEGVDANWGALCLLDTVYNVTDWIFYGLLSLVSLLTVWGGALILWGGGDPDKVKKGREYILFATIGLIVAFLSKLIPSIAQSIIGA